MGAGESQKAEKRQKMGKSHRALQSVVSTTSIISNGYEPIDYRPHKQLQRTEDDEQDEDEASMDWNESSDGDDSGGGSASPMWVNEVITTFGDSEEDEEENENGQGTPHSASNSNILG